MILFIGISRAYIWPRTKKSTIPFHQSYLAQITLPSPPEDFDTRLAQAVATTSPRFEFKRLDASDDTADATLLVELTAPPTTLMRAIQTTFPGARISITHTQGLV
jgi:hypothetical protein